MARAAWFFPIPEETTLPDRLQSLLAKARERLGFVPNVFRAYSYRPDRFSAWFTHYQGLHEPTEHLDTADREMIAVVVSAYNRCTYCIVAHGHALRVALGDQYLADQIATNWRHAELDPRRAAICAVAEKLTATPHLMTEDDLLALAGYGLDRDEVWDVLEIAAMYNFTNRMALALGQQPNEEYHYRDRQAPDVPASDGPGRDQTGSAITDAAESAGRADAQNRHTAS
jgi:uncharacterized peroxidase-related enzyme